MSRWRPPDPLAPIAEDEDGEEEGEEEEEGDEKRVLVPFAAEPASRDILRTNHPLCE